MLPHVNDIIVIWREGKGKDRIPIAIVKNDGNNTVFKYIEDGVDCARRNGFVCFPDFPVINKVYDKNVLNALSQRVNNRERSDIEEYYNFWEIPSDARKDTFLMVAYTQGILPTDNFEFLAEYSSVEGVRFVSEITGLTKNKLDNNCISEGDELEWRCEPENESDNMAVALYKENRKLGYVKRIHNQVFHLRDCDKLKVKVKKIEHNGHISRVLILIYNKETDSIM